MNKQGERSKALIWVSFMCLCTLVLGLVACAPQNEEQNNTGGTEQTPTPEANELGIITADSWADTYPNEYASYKENEKNSERAKYTDLYPEIAVIWEGTPFSEYYEEARGHTYALTDVRETGRDPKTANCLTCKSSEFIVMQKEDPTLNVAAFADVSNTVTEPVSCYDCHENTPTEQTVAIRQFFVDAVGSDASQLPEGVISCGQCHNEYYFTGENKDVTNPYTSLAEATPEAVLSYENEINQVDYTNPSTGAGLIKVQHPEFETIYGGEQSAMAKQGYSCADCHMAPATDDQGNTYSSHYWTSPLANGDLINNNCSNCHEDLAAEVAAWQDETVTRIHSVGDKLVTLNEKLAQAVTDKSKTEDELTKIRSLNRDAQFYWDWVMVENSEGVHNPTLAKDTLDKSEAAVDDALALL